VAWHRARVRPDHAVAMGAPGIEDVGGDDLPERLESALLQLARLDVSIATLKRRVSTLELARSLALRAAQRLSGEPSGPDPAVSGSG
jgi:hypothetical protein